MYFTGLAVRLLPLDPLVRQFVQVTLAEFRLLLAVPPREEHLPPREAALREEHLPLRAVVHREEHLPLREAGLRREAELPLARNPPASIVVIALPSFLPASSC